MNYWVQLATEQFPPSELVDQAVEAERAGFDALNVSDHFQPWWEPGHSGQAWTLLGAICHATGRIGVGTGVTAPVYRYNPAVVAQFAATVEELAPGRGFLGIGSGEALNETPCGMDWPDTGEQVRRMEEALEIIGRLLDGDRLDYDGRFSGPGRHTCTLAGPASRRCTCRPSGPTRPAWRPASATACGRSPTRRPPRT